ncbi:Di-copper centre-containing protein [Gigaspora margarita]|uniref:tyrosinase n=1 Tax=Gigaspora margarita TaxID=4874 RepID=A0A8H3WZW9_GIGMA|nr:Di-copper centre-containing protein [Gigaspora margarita]
MGLSHSSSYHSSHVRSVTESGPVIIEPYSTVYPRLDVLDMYNDEKYRPQFDLLVQSYQAIFDRPYEDMRSFYQIAGIHGLPYSAYDGVKGDHEYHNDTDWAQGRWGGYCHHGDVLFPPWHRPYMMLIESQLISEAKKIASQYPDNEKEKYVDAANQLRHPYWDWADLKAMNGVPEFFTSLEIELNTPKGKKNVTNPLKRYHLPVSLSYPLPDGQNPNDAPNYTLPSMDFNPYTPAGYPTVRHPNSKYEDQDNIMNQNFSVYVPTVFRPGFYQMFHIENFLHFSNHAVRGSNDTEMEDTNPGHPNPLVFVGYAHFASIETTHDGFHLVSGGLAGHLSYPDITGFDPLFFFHHCNVDRMFALWQGVFPNSWIPESVGINGTYTDVLYSKVNENTALTPFRKSTTDFWTSKDVRDVEKLGYTYPDLAKFKGQDPKNLQAYLLELYKPDPHYGRRFYVKLTIEAGKLVGPYSIRVFIDLPSANAETPVTSPHFAGFVAMWRNNAHTKVNSTTYVTGTVDITDCMVKLGIRMQKHDYVQDVNATTGEVKPTSIFDVNHDINIVPVLLDGKSVGPKDAGVTTIEAFSFEHDKVNQNFLVESTGEFYGTKKF